jgi:16S rRNA (cytosine967-C5)-methyltransferase
MLARPDGSDVIVYTQEIAAEVLKRLEEEIISEKEALRQRFLREDYDYKIRGSVHAYVMETAKRLNTIDFILQKALRFRGIQDIDPFIRNLLRVGIYEMFYKGIHPALATDSCVRVARLRKGNNAARLVNAVMRNAEKVNLERELERLKAKNRRKYLALRYFHPEWFVELAEKLFGNVEDIENIMAANLQQTVYVRANTLKASEERVKKYLDKEGVILEETFLPEVFKVVAYNKPPAILEGHKEGLYVIQDFASCLVARTLNPKPGETVLDIAAAPGSKTSHIAALMENRGKIIAVDNSRERLERMKARMKVLGVQNVEYVCADGAEYNIGYKEYNRMVDKVLIDPPCSSTGSLRNYPSVKWRYDKKKYIATVKLQQRMLKNAFKNLEAGGVAVYSTCSITFEENEENILQALETFKLGDAYIGFGSPGISEFNGKRFPYADKVVRTYPHIHDTAGFFIAKLTV